MWFEYVCVDCSEVTDYRKPYEEKNAPAEIKCSSCGGVAKKKPFAGNIIIPESFKATSS